MPFSGTACASRQGGATQLYKCLSVGLPAPAGKGVPLNYTNATQGTLAPAPDYKYRKPLRKKQATIEISRSFRYRLFDLELETGEVFSSFIYNRKTWNSKHRVTPFYKSVSNEGVHL